MSGKKVGFTKKTDPPKRSGNGVQGGGNRGNTGNRPQQNRDGGKERRAPPDPVLVGSLSLVEQIDKRVVVVLRDRKNVIGTLRSFDGYANVVLEEAFERLYVGDCYGDVPLQGWFIARAENVILVGELDDSGRDVVGLKRVDSKEIRDLQRGELEKERARRKILSEMDEVNQDEF